MSSVNFLLFLPAMAVSRSRLRSYYQPSSLGRRGVGAIYTRPLGEVPAKQPTWENKARNSTIELFIYPIKVGSRS